MIYELESPEHYFYSNDGNGNEVEIDYVDLLAEVDADIHEEYKTTVVSITWKKSEYTKEENATIQAALNDPEKRKKIEKKIINDFINPPKDF